MASMITLARLWLAAHLPQGEEGQTGMEYAVIAAVVIIAAAAAYTGGVPAAIASVVSDSIAAISGHIPA